MKNKTMAKFVEFTEKWDFILFILGLVVVGFLLCGIANAFAGQETIKDDNDGNKGYILINTGTQQGGNDVGHWTDITTIPELKGDTGEAGKDGIGIQGDKGDIGNTGQVGKDVDPALVTDLQNTDIDLGNNINTETNNRIEAINLQNETNSRQDRTLQDHESRIGTLEETQYNVRGELKFIREKNFEVGVYSKYNTNRNVCSEVGLSITINLGESYTDREIRNMNKKIAVLQKTMDRLIQRSGVEEFEVKKEITNKGVSFSINKEGTTKFLKRF